MPLQATTLEALNRLPARRETPLLFRSRGAHYGHLARDGRNHAAALLDSLAAAETAAAAWTSGGRREIEPEGSRSGVQSAIDSS